MWTDGSKDTIEHLDVEIAGADIHSPASGIDNHAWGCCEDLDGIDEGDSRSVASLSGPCKLFNAPSIGESFSLYIAFSGVTLAFMRSEGLPEFLTLVSQIFPSLQGQDLYYDFPWRCCHYCCVQSQRSRMKGTPNKDMTRR